MESINGTKGKMMKAKELYDEEYFYNYQPIINSFGDIVVQIDENGYQGDTWVLFKNNDKYGYIQFGWGSCSGCDALQACNTYDDVENLIDEMANSIMWFDSKTNAIEYFESDSRKDGYAYYYNEFKTFLSEVILKLKEETK